MHSAVTSAHDAISTASQARLEPERRFTAHTVARKAETRARRIRAFGVVRPQAGSVQRRRAGVTLGALALQSGVVDSAGTRMRWPRAWLIAVGLACVCACGDATHTVGMLGADRAPAAGGAGSAQAGRTGSGASSPSAGSVAPGDVGTPDGGSDTGAPLDPIVMLGEPAFSCRGDATDALRRRLDLFLMVDTNLFDTVGTVISEGLNNAWLQLSRGIFEYVDDPRAAGTGVGIGYFPPAITVSIQPTSPACALDTYAKPAAEVSPLPENATAIKRSFPVLPLGLGSPTLPALQGAIKHARSRFNGTTYKQAVVLVTDRVSDFACFSEPNAIVDAAAASAIHELPVPTYVVALTSPQLENVLATFVRFEQLDEVATQGGTRIARVVNLDDRRDSLAETLYRIQADAEPCQYEVSAAVRDAPTATALGTVTAGTAPLPLPRLDSESECGQGYYFDDPADPAWATLCRDTCTALKASTRTVVWIDECDMP
jgi:hypothetical protein